MSQTVWKYSSTWHDSNRYIQNIMKLLFNMTPPNIMMLMCTKHYGAFVLQWHLPIFWRRWCTPNIIHCCICNVLHDTFQYRYIPNIMNLIFYMTPYNILWRGNWLIFLFVEKLCSNIIMSVCTCSYYERSTIYNTIFMSGLQCPCVWLCSLFITISLQCVSLKTSKF